MKTMETLRAKVIKDKADINRFHTCPENRIKLSILNILNMKNIVDLLLATMILNSNGMTDHYESEGSNGHL